MLVYIRESHAKAVLLQEVTEEDIPQELIDRLQEEKRVEMIRRKERNEAHLYMNINVVLEDTFSGHQGNDLYDPEKINFRIFRAKKSATLQQFLEQVAESLKYPIEQIRPWPMNLRNNQTNRPTLLDLEGDLQKSLIEASRPQISDNGNPWTLYMETVPPDSELKALPTFDKDSDVLLFFKYYDPRHKRLHYCGHHYMHISFNVYELVPILNERAGLPQRTELALWEEVRPNYVERLSELDRPLEKVLEELMDGDIIVFQRADLIDDPSLELPTCREYFKDYSLRVEVIFCDKSIPQDPGIAIELSQRMNYDQMARAVAHRLGTDPYLLQFFKVHPHRDGPGNPIKCTYEGTLENMFSNPKPRNPKKIYYQQLSIRINELENKRLFKCSWIADKLKEEVELVLYPNKNGTVADLLQEARKQVTLSENGSSKLRYDTETQFRREGCSILDPSF
ncbi:UNVERIFIED_CONTAM: hypothetical protein GTU68_036606 [Idotea baltica]|nr:hypothetical protein [Idotea baltica]